MPAGAGLGTPGPFPFDAPDAVAQADAPACADAQRPGALVAAASVMLGAQAACGAIAVALALLLPAAGGLPPRSGPIPPGAPLPAAAALVVGLVAIAALLRAERIRRRLRAQNRELAVAASTDALTGLGNRRRFARDLRACWLDATESGRDLCLLMIDADHFKQFNDTFGHPEGDRMLRAIADVLDGVLAHGTGRAYRHGGEEFALLLPGAGAEAGREIAESAMAAVTAMARARPRVDQSRFTVSIGLAAAAPGRARGGPEQFLRAADDALYQAKRDGRGRVREAGPPPWRPRPVPPDPAATQPPSGAPPVAERVAGTEIVLGDGRLIRIAQPIEPRTIAEIARLLERR